MANRTKRTAKKDLKFFDHLAQTGNVGQAAKLAGYSRQQSYQYRADADFAGRWEDALAVHIEALEAECDRRGKDGIDKPVFWKGEKIAAIKQYSDNLLMFRLKALAPEKYRERIDAKVSGDVVVHRKIYSEAGD